MRILLVGLLFLFSCSGLQRSGMIDESQISEPVKAKLNEARELIKTNRSQLAIAKLSELNDQTLTPIEKALKYNLKGVTLFNLAEIDKALSNFEVAEKYSPKETHLYQQVQLNMASGFYKLNQFNDLRDRLRKINKKYLTDVELKKHAQLALAYGNKIQNDRLIVSSTLTLLGDAKTLADVQNSNSYDSLKESFSRLSQGQKIDLLEEFNSSKNLGAAQLAQLEAETRYMSGDKSGAKGIVSWLRSEFSSNEEVRKFVKEFELRIENSGRISINDIGLVLPLTGDKASFGQKALSGIESGLKILGLNENIKVHTKDSVDSPAQGSQAVLELIREERVSFIIGGLFPETAKAEYLEARKYGVLYISLSQVDLPKEDKNHHLIEVQGSIESQIETLLSEEMINKFGSRIGVVFPNNDSGKAYVDEIWRKASLKNLQITSIASFPKNTHDYRDTAQLFLGLKYPRERAEELKILNDIYALERSSIRRVQTLPPILDFEWVFLATYPHEAAQLIPTLGYYDANKIKVVGGPSWVSKSLVKEQKNLGTLYFVGDDPKDVNQEMLAKFQERTGKQASLIEIISLDAMKLGAEALRISGEVSDRDEFDSRLKSKGKLRGLATDWEYKDGIWLKRMNALAITQGRIVKLFGGESI